MKDKQTCLSIESGSTVDESKKLTVFEQAFRAYTAALSEKKNTRKLIIDSLPGSGSPVNTPESIRDIIEEIERKAADKFSRRAFNRILKPVVDAVSAYAGVIDTFCQTDPLPISIIWGAFRIFIENIDIKCGGRFASLFETIKKQLLDLRNHLERISFYEELYKHPPMQELLCKSYVNVLRFWARVRKECERHTFGTFLRAAGPFSTKKMNDIVLDLNRDATAIEALAERIEKGRNQTHRDMTEQHMAQQEEYRKVRSYNELKQWLNIGNASQFEEADYSRHDRNRNEQNCTFGTSEWIFEVAEFEKWANATSNSSPVLWLSGSPGAGKSVLCSRVIQYIRDTQPSSAVAFHFFSFDQRSSTIEVLRVMAIQLLENLWNSVKELPDTILAITQKSPNNYKNVVEMIKAITSSPAMLRAFLFIDGLDEAEKGTMDLLLKNLISVAISDDARGTVRLWLSSQPHVLISEQMVSFPKIHFARQNEADIRLLFEKRLPELGDVSVDEEEKNRWLTVLNDQAKGNFLWARYMIDNLVEKAESIADIKALIDHALPPDINEYYRRQFKRIGPHFRDLASKIFSIVCYSRRPVSVSEICDAIGLMRMRDPSYKDDEVKPFPLRVRKLLPPMIIEEEFRDGAEKRCRLFHSTVKEFLKKNPLVEGISITPSVLADVCLLYLCQPRYGGLLKKIDGEWKTADGESIEEDHFLQYTAKYWYLHMDNVEPSTEFTDRILAFLKSPNFQTLLQLQYLYVEGQFSVFRMAGIPDKAKFLKRAFPSWFISRISQTPNSKNARLLEDYRLFLHEWSHLLRCGCCENIFCARSLCAGEIDRCFFGALGEDNFMAAMESRYLSFRFSTTDDKGINAARQCYDGYSACGKAMYLVQFESRTGSTLHFVCETWHLKTNQKPTLHRRQTIDADVKKANWSFYFKNDDKNVYVRLGRAKPISFDYDARTLRIGSQLYIRDDEGIFQSVPVESLTVKGQRQSYFEEFVTGPGVVVVASRRRAPSVNEARSSKESVDDAVQDLAKLFDRSHSEDHVTTDTDDSQYSQSESASLDSSTSETGVDWTSGAETWSEASTEPEDVLEDENALIVFRGYIDSSESDSESFGTDGDVGEIDSSDEEGSSESDQNTLEATPYSRFMRGYLDDDSDGDDAYVSLGPWTYGIDDSDESDTGGLRPFRSLYGMKFRRKNRTNTGPGLEASIAVFTATPESGFKCVFRLSRQLSLVLYESPPVLHPSKPFLVWPMSPGNIVFADFGQKTWFTRKLRPTTSYTRQVFVKCHFSSCGQYLHIAILEARRKPSQRGAGVGKQKKKEPESDESQNREEPLELSLFVTTHRLSTHKTTRAPPVQIYRSKISLGYMYSLPVSRLPFSLTWTPTELYFTQSSTVLIVYRIKLFQPPPGEEAILVPQDLIFLPSTVRAREMRLFYPEPTLPRPDAGNDINQIVNTALVLMGPERKSSASSTEVEASHHNGGQDDDGDAYENGIVDGWVSRPEAIKGLPHSSSLPMGFYFHDADVGGWVRSEDIQHLPDDRGVGQLDHKVERFDVEEDCDLEPYII